MKKLLVALVGSVAGVFASLSAFGATIRVEYVEASGKASVDTGYKANAKTVIAFSGQYVDRNGQTYPALFKDYTAEGSVATRVILNNTNEKNVLINCYTRADKTWSLQDVISTAGQVITGLLNRATNTCVVNGKTATGAKSVGTLTDKTVKLHDPDKTSVTRLHYLTVSEDGEVLHDFRPCVRDDVAGYVDLVDDSFHTSSTGTLTAGPTCPPDVLKVTTSLGVDLGVTPACGRITDLADGSQVACSAPAAWTNDSGSAAAVCTGWKLYDVDGVQVDAGVTTSFTYTHPTPAVYRRLVWQWQQAPTVTVKNFDEDLATVYVNGVATTNGQVVAVIGAAKIELKDFRNDYYFRFAPASQADRTLALDCWEGMPAGYETANPAIFTPEANLTITANVDVKGYAWTLDTATSYIDDGRLCCGFTGRNDTLRTISTTICVTNWLVTAANKTVYNHVFDGIQRVRYNDKNYTIAGYGTTGKGAFANSRIGTLAVAPRTTSFGTNVASGGNYSMTNIVGAADIKAITINGGAFSHAGAAFSGPATNFVPIRTTSTGSYPYQGKSGLTGELLLASIQTVGGKSFCNCTGLNSLRITSSRLTSVGNIAFSGCSNMKEVTFAGDLSLWTSLDATAFANVITNVNFTVNPPRTAILDNLLAAQTAKDGAHSCKLTVDPALANWWGLASAPTDNEVQAGLPPNFMGVYVTGGGDRKAWVVGSTALGGVLLEGDMTMAGNDGFVPRTGLEVGSQVQMTAPEGFGQCALQHMVHGVWTTFETKKTTSFTYVHDGELTRAVWKIDGALLTTTVNSYGGAIAVELVSGSEISSGIYTKGSVVRLTATGQTATHPTSHFNGWTSGVSAEYVQSNVVDVTLDADVSAAADFYPDEWIYTNATTITDGEWTITSSSLANGEITVSGFSGGQNGVLWLDFSLPIHPYNNLSTNYVVTGLSVFPNNLRRLKLGPEFRSLNHHFDSSAALEDIYGLGASSVTVFPYAFLVRCDGSPLHAKVYEANFFVPPGLKEVGAGCDLSGAPYLKGTFELNAAKTFWDDVNKRANSFNVFNGLLWNNTYGVGVTNMIISTEEPTILPGGLFSNAHVESVTLGMTNLVTAGSSPFSNVNGAFRHLTFLAHAPTVSALDNILVPTTTTNLAIYCSRHAPGWKAMRMSNYRAAAEWEGRPEGTWGIYQTANGKKRYYMVQRDSKYDHRDGFTVLVK